MTRTVVALLFVLLSAIACKSSGAPDGSPSPSASATRTPQPAATPTPSPEPQTGLPARDLLDLAQRFRGVPAGTSLVARDAPYAHAVGDSAEFTVIDLNTPSITTITATVRLITDHAYFFVENASYRPSALQTIGSTEGAAHPTVRDAPEPAR
jgi:hypothetical protein